ncbi:NAD(P)-dependent alcohol dehydrogenase [Spirosoma arcticum]
MESTTETIKTVVMPAAVAAYAALEAGQPLLPYQYTPKTLSASDVEIKITHCGMCHTDLHLVNNDFGISAFPLVPGHEIVGIVSQLGAAVTDLTVGQRVGVGWLAGADFTCDQCQSGQDNLCVNGQPTCLGREGGYAQYIRVDSRLTFPIPDALPSEYAAPLLCAGITVFAPLLRHHVSAATRLGVIGIGGLGHLALQYGKALGCQVTAFSSSPDKETEARQFGADRFVNTSAEGVLATAANTCDFLLSTVTADMPWTDYLNVLRPGGKLCMVGVPDADLKLSALQMILGQKSVLTSIIGSRLEIRAMLDFSARHQIKPQIEVFPLAEVNTALRRIARNTVRYRAVLTME